LFEVHHFLKKKLEFLLLIIRTRDDDDDDDDSAVQWLLLGDTHTHTEDKKTFAFPPKNMRSLLPSTFLPYFLLILTIYTLVLAQLPRMECLLLAGPLRFLCGIPFISLFVCKKGTKWNKEKEDRVN
jgi:hypothetical protein